MFWRLSSPHKAMKEKTEDQMAQLLKDRARKPIVEEAAAIASRMTVGGKVGYRLDLFVRHPAPGYSIALTRDEMLRAVALWLEAEAKDATEVAKQPRR